MAQEKTIEEKLKLLEREISTIAEELDKIGASLQDIEDLKTEMKALKLCLNRHMPEFKKEFPGILKKL
jgi:predicted  nucleic acid-binding Zn-ribbon protein